MSRVVAYLRVSSAERKGKNETIENQRSYAKQYAAQMGIKLSDVYEDNDVSGTIPMIRRPSGGRLMDDVRGGGIDTLLIYKIDRLGRDTIDGLATAKELFKSGVQIVSMTEPFDTRGPQGEFLFTIFLAVAQMERTNILDRTMLGRVEAVQNGRWVGGHILYGYTVKDKKLVPHPEQAEVVRRIFQLYIDGMLHSDIARLLNREGIPGPTGGEWGNTALATITRNRTYTGVGTYRKFKHIKENGEYVRWEKQPEENHIQFQMPPIIDIATFETAAQVKSHQPRQGRKANKLYLLSGLIRCDDCKGPMYATGTRKPSGLVFTYYRCPSCRKSLPAAQLEKVVWEDVKEFAASPGDISESLRTSIESRECELANLEKQLEGKESEKHRVLALFRKNLMSEADVEQQMIDIAREGRELKAEIERVRSYEYNRRNLEHQADSLERTLLLLKDKAEDPEFDIKRRVVKDLVESVEIGEKAKIIYRFETASGVLTINRVLKL